MTDAELREKIEKHLVPRLAIYLNTVHNDAVPDKEAETDAEEWIEYAKRFIKNEFISDFVTQELQKAKKELLSHLLTSNPIYTHACVKDLLDELNSKDQS